MLLVKPSEMEVGKRYRCVWSADHLCIWHRPGDEILIDSHSGPAVRFYNSRRGRRDILEDSHTDHWHWMEVLPRDGETEMEEAARIVSQDRNDTYGDPAEDHARTGRIWGALLGINDIPAETVALMMAGLKMSRETFKPGRDNRVDMHGYVENRRMILDAKA